MRVGGAATTAEDEDEIFLADFFVEPFSAERRMGVKERLASLDKAAFEGDGMRDELFDAPAFLIARLGKHAIEPYSEGADGFGDFQVGAESIVVEFSEAGKPYRVIKKLEEVFVNGIGLFATSPVKP